MLRPLLVNFNLLVCTSLLSDSFDTVNEHKDHKMAFQIDWLIAQTSSASLGNRVLLWQ